MKTAMQELLDFLRPELEMHYFSQLPAYEKAFSLLEIEKQQIIEAAIHGANFDSSPFEDAVEYYNETFKQ